MAKPKSPYSKQKDRAGDAPRSGRTRSAGDLLGEIGGVAFRRFGFVQSAIVSRWSEIVGERYAKVSSPESIRFPAGRKSGGVLTLLVEGAHGPLLQHLSPLIMERVNRFFGHQAIDRVVFRQGRPIAKVKQPERPHSGPVPKELGEACARSPIPSSAPVWNRLPRKLRVQAALRRSMRRRRTPFQSRFESE